MNVSEITKLSKSKKIDLEKIMDALVQENILEKKIPWSQVKFYKSDKNKKDSSENNKKIMISEVLKISPIVKEMILNNKNSEDIEKQALKEGMFSLEEELIFKAVQGLINIDLILIYEI